MTHPFHPLRGYKFTLVTRKYNWSEDRVCYFNNNGKLCSMLASWTNIDPPDTFYEAANGRSWFRINDLSELSNTLKILLERYDSEARGVK